MRVKHETPDATVMYSDHRVTRSRTYDLIKDWFFRNELFTGEQIHQSDCFDECELKELLRELAEDVFDFEVEWKED